MSACSAHTHCDKGDGSKIHNFYAAIRGTKTFHKCIRCKFCHAGKDSITGRCPAHCVPTAGATTKCDGHRHCNAAEFCSARKLCMPCQYRHKNSDAVDKKCPTRCMPPIGSKCDAHDRCETTPASSARKLRGAGMACACHAITPSRTTRLAGNAQRIACPPRAPVATCTATLTGGWSSARSWTIRSNTRRGRSATRNALLLPYAWMANSQSPDAARPTACCTRHPTAADVARASSTQTAPPRRSAR